MAGAWLVHLAATTDGEGVVRTFAPNSKTLVGLSARDTGGLIYVYNKPADPHTPVGCDGGLFTCAATSDFVV